MDDLERLRRALGGHVDGSRHGRPLAPRLKEVGRLLHEGYTVPEIAAQLSLGQGTVLGYMKSLRGEATGYAQKRVGTSEAIEILHKQGLLDDSDLE